MSKGDFGHNTANFGNKLFSSHSITAWRFQLCIGVSPPFTISSRETSQISSCPLFFLFFNILFSYIYFIFCKLHSGKFIGGSTVQHFAVQFGKNFLPFYLLSSLFVCLIVKQNLHRLSFFLPLLIVCLFTLCLLVFICTPSLFCCDFSILSEPKLPRWYASYQETIFLILILFNFFALFFPLCDYFCKFKRSFLCSASDFLLCFNIFSLVLINLSEFNLNFWCLINWLSDCFWLLILITQVTGWEWPTLM